MSSGKWFINKNETVEKGIENIFFKKKQILELKNIATELKNSLEESNRPYQTEERIGKLKNRSFAINQSEKE